MSNTTGIPDNFTGSLRRTYTTTDYQTGLETNYIRLEHYLNGMLHKEGGPARDAVDTKEWFIEGQRHREDGPAIVVQGDPDSGGIPTKRWFLRDRELTEEQFNRFLEMKALNEKLQINLPDKNITKKGKI